MISLGIFFACTVVMFVPGLASQCGLTLQGGNPLQFFSIFSSHLSHYGFSHYFWNMAATLPLALYCERVQPKRLLLTLLSSSFFISIALLFFPGELAHYRGFSGVASGLLGLFFVLLYQNSSKKNLKRLLSFIMVTYFLKIGYESGKTDAFFVSFEMNEVVSVPLAHLVGYLCGLACGFFPELFQKRQTDFAKSPLSSITQ